jgi:hypothetical protein
MTLVGCVAMSGSQLALVQTVLAATRGDTTVEWKLALLELKTYAPDAECTAVVVRAYERGQCEPWCTAALLEAIGHPDGYATALEILQLAPGSLAESYAGPALVRMRGAEALDDLAAVLDDERLPQRAHEGAAFGLAAMSDPRADDVLLRAVDQGRVRTSVAGNVACERGIPAARLISWLRGGDSRRRNLAAWTVFHLAAQGPLLKELEIAMHAALADAPLPFTAAQRHELRERLAN